MQEKPRNGHKKAKFVSEMQKKPQNGHKNAGFVAESQRGDNKTASAKGRMKQNTRFVPKTQKKPQKSQANRALFPLPECYAAVVPAEAE